MDQYKFVVGGWAYMYKTAKRFVLFILFLAGAVCYELSVLIVFFINTWKPWEKGGYFQKKNAHIHFLEWIHLRF